jgi:hypothetical protein
MDSHRPKEGLSHSRGLTVSRRRVRRLLMAPNAVAVRKRKTQDIVAILLEAYGDDSRLHARGGNPQRLSHNGETPENPRRVWTFKRLEPEFDAHGHRS